MKKLQQDIFAVPENAAINIQQQADKLFLPGHTADDALSKLKQQHHELFWEREEVWAGLELDQAATPDAKLTNNGILFATSHRVIILNKNPQNARLNDIQSFLYADIGHVSVTTPNPDNFTLYKPGEGKMPTPSITIYPKTQIRFDPLKVRDGDLGYTYRCKEINAASGYINLMPLLSYITNQMYEATKPKL